MKAAGRNGEGRGRGGRTTREAKGSERDGAVASEAKGRESERQREWERDEAGRKG